MVHTEKQKLQKARAFFKYVLSGLIKPVNYTYLSYEEKILWTEIKAKQKRLLTIHDDNNREFGLNVPKFRCHFCSKEAVYNTVASELDEYRLCKKHFEEYEETL